MDVRPRPSLIEDPQAAETRRGLPDHADRRAGRNDTGLGDGMRSGEFGLGQDFFGEREQAFAQRLNHALGERDVSEHATQGEEGLSLLAVAGLPLAGAGVVPSTRPETVADTPQLDAMIERIEKVLTSRGIETSPGNVSLTLDFGDLGGSIGGVTITLSSKGIDVVLSRTGEVADGYVQAAQVLADRLHARFPKRIVRILEAEPQREAPAQGLAAFSRLLDPSGDRS
ncbi:hypothetical protein PRN20_04625 [Devosia sp. ZB163]|uniref:hypothetical protein n=1 Tax=Devosia sp. ZB163 TaxID=3025938 RepID=UPI00235FD02A|nr:hypothetical protein [Devosia sp. ZB163]MDC9823007.1 hypothetical protein [Devosia sp. ZB163]